MTLEELTRLLDALPLDYYDIEKWEVTASGPAKDMIVDIKITLRPHPYRIFFNSDAADVVIHTDP